MRNDTTRQRDYYQATASWYDDYHIGVETEHEFALDFMLSTLERFDIQSILDVGSGTGRVPLAVKKRKTDIRVVGVEPSLAMRKVGYAKGLDATELMDGDATSLPFANGEFDLVC